MSGIEKILKTNPRIVLKFMFFTKVLVYITIASLNRLIDFNEVRNRSYKFLLHLEI